MKNNKICKLLGIKYPIFQGAMAWISNGNLAGNVSKEGGLGIIAAGRIPADLLRVEIKKAREITKNPIGVNLMLLNSEVDSQLDVCIEEKVELVTTGAGNPARFIDKIKAANIKIFPVVAGVSVAKKVAQLGVDGIIVEGMEAGGHIGSDTTMSLLSQVVDAVDVPVLAAGGIANGKQFLACIANGAVGVQCGTIFLTSYDCTIHPKYKEVVINAKDRSTVSTGNYTGHPVRTIKNELATAMLEKEKSGASPKEIEKMGEGSLALAAVKGDIVNGSVMAGQVVALVNEEKTTKDILDGLMEGFYVALKDMESNIKSWD